MADEPKSHRIQVTCPECGHQQAEPSIVVSSVCRSCNSNFKVEDGKAVAAKKADIHFTKVRKEPESEPEPLSVEKRPTLESEPTPKRTRSLFQRFFDPIKPPREITCFECGSSFNALAEASSSQCPKCGSYISLRNYEITEHWNRRIETRGDITIHKSGTIAGATVRCHHLTVMGELSGSVECSGDLIIRSHGKIIGTVKCKNLRVEKGARVEFLNPVTAGSARIDGQVHGQLYCAGSVTLEKRAQLHGLVRTTSLVVKPGAKHNGIIEMVSKDPS